MASNVPTNAPDATGHTSSSRGHVAAVPPATADPAQSSTAAALIDSINASARMHQPPRGIGKHSHPGSGPSSGLTIGNIMDDSKGPRHTSAGGAGVPPAAANPAETSTSASLTDSRATSSEINHDPRGVHEPVLGNVADEGQVCRE